MRFFAFILSLIFPLSLTAQNTRIWATYYGDNDDDLGGAVVTDASGNVYLAGTTASLNNIASGGFQNTYGGGIADAFLAKFNSAGVLQWATYYGDSGQDRGYGIAVDASGNVYLGGLTTSTTNIASGGFQNVHGGNVDAFIVKFDATGARLWATYYGGSASDDANAIATDASGNVYMVGQTSSPTGIAAGGFQNTYGGGGDAFLVKINANGTWGWGTYYGGANADYAYGVCTRGNNVYIAGFTDSPTAIASGGFQNTLAGNNDAFVAKFNLTTGTLVWGTYYGDSNDDSSYGIATDASGNVYVAGWTSSNTGIASGGYQNSYGGGFSDGFLVKFDPNCVRLWATYYGGTGLDFGYCVVTDANNNVYLGGYTGSAAGIASGGFKTTFTGAWDDYIVNFDPNGIRGCATYYEAQNPNFLNSIAVDNSGNLYLASNTAAATGIASGGHQNTYGGGGSDADLIKFTSCAPTTISITATPAGTSCYGYCDGAATATPTGGGASYTYVWSPSGGTNATATGLCAGIYTITVSDGTAVSTKTVQITQPAALVISDTTKASCNFLPNGIATVTVSGGTGPYTYLWSNGNTTNSISNLNAGADTVWITDFNGCTIIDTVHIGNGPTVQASADDTICEGQSITLSANATISTNYIWSNGASAQNINVSPTINSSYTVTVSNNQCNASDVVFIKVNPAPTIITSNNSIIASGTSVSISATGGVYYSWNPATGLNCNTCQFPLAKPEETTLYCVTVTDALGCVDTACLTVEVLCKDIFVPTAFSPNDDGQNDVFKVYGSCMKNIDLVIFNRWGEKVFEITDITQTWDGTFMNEKLNTAVFAYTLRATTTNSKEIIKKGTISLVR